MEQCMLYPSVSSLKSWNGHGSNNSLHVIWRPLIKFFFFFAFKDKDEEWWKQVRDMGSFRNTQTMTRGKEALVFSSFFLFLIFTFSQSSTRHPAAHCFPILKFPQSFRCSQFHNAQMLSFGPLPPHPQPELSFITFLWSWEWKRWDKEERGGAESNMAAYLEDFLYWNMCKQFTHKGLK